jgi:hypothetical protein
VTGSPVLVWIVLAGVMASAELALFHRVGFASTRLDSTK